MIYTIEKRFSFGYGEMESWWEARSYERRTPIGVLVGGKCLKKSKKKSDCCDYFGRNNIPMKVQVVKGDLFLVNREENNETQD